VTRVLVVDGANVVGATPDGWWKDRAGAARRLHERLLVADTAYDEVVFVLEGRAKGGVKAGRDLHVTTIHARRDGDSAIIGVVNEARERDEQVTVITADRVLRGAVEHLGARAMSPSWLLDQL
jgi:predicted RNA-binding protein with PIN domain